MDARETQVFHSKTEFWAQWTTPCVFLASKPYTHFPYSAPVQLLFCSSLTVLFTSLMYCCHVTATPIAVWWVTRWLTVQVNGLGGNSAGLSLPASGVVNNYLGDLCKFPWINRWHLSLFGSPRSSRSQRFRLTSCRAKGPDPHWQLVPHRCQRNTGYPNRSFSLCSKFFFLQKWQNDVQ